MRLRLGTKIKNRVWRPIVRRWGIAGATTIVAVSAILLIGGGAVLAQLYGGADAPSSTSVDLQKGLVGWWKFDGNTKDSTPFANNATIHGNVTLTSDREGTANSAYTFDANTNDYMTAPAQTAISYQKNYSISLWFETNSTGYQTILESSPSCSDRNGIGVQSSGVDFGYYPGSGGWIGASSTAVSTGTWYNVVATNQSGTLKLYLNGVLQSGTSGPYVACGVSMYLGKTSNSVDFFNGSLSDLRVYNRVLSQSEAMALYNEYNPSLNADSDENDLVGWWKMDGNAKDSTPFANNGTLYNSPTLTTDREGRTNSAYSFNGTNQWFRLPNSTNYDPGTSGSESWSMWFKTSSTATQFIYRKSDSCNDNGFILESNVMAVGKIDGYISYYPSGACTGTATTVRVTSTASTYNDGNWHLATVVLNRTNNTLYMYIDGQFVTSSDASGLSGINLTAANYPSIASSYGGSQFFNGSLDDVRVYNRAVSAAEASNIYNSYNSQLNIDTNPSGSTNPTNNIYSGLVGYWPFSGNAKDSTPYGNNGTVSNATLTTDHLGNANSAYSFNGTTAYIDMGSSSLFAFTGSFSLSAWVYPTTSTGWEGIASRWGTTWAWALDTTSHRNAFYLSTQGWVYSNSSVPTNAWSYITVVYNGTAHTASFYLNGAADGSVADNGTIGNTGDLTVGSWGSNYYFNGSIDNVRIYNRALSASEVSALYSETN